MTATAFIPSQVISSKKKKKEGGIDLIPTRTIHEHKKSLFLVPSQSINSSNNRKKNNNRTKLQETFDANVNKNKKDASTSTSTSTLNTKTQGKKTKKHSFQYYGNLPDVHWRAIPMEHLRLHPKYKPLPIPTTITNLKNIEQVRQFRQDSWQWDALHTGRCTTSQSAPALGFLEPKAAKLLGIPRSLQKSPMEAFRRLSQKALRTLEDMNHVLCHHDTLPIYENYVEEHCLWREMKNVKHYPFSAKYLPFISKADLKVRKEDTDKYMQNLSSSMRVRMSWGNSQEATAILTALNYFTHLDPDVILEEVGMCGAGLALNCTEGDEHALILGASPDSIITYGNGTSEVLEVKNHCPFVPTDWVRSGSKKQKQRRKSKGGFRIRELPLQYSVPPAYIPQLMMEILCCGESCRSAIMVRQTATCGAVILRLHRDDEWISEMIYWLKMFMSEYVSKETSPPQNFFFDGHEESNRYQRFLERTKALSESVELVKEVRHNDIQRVLGENGLRLPLFLDNLGHNNSR